MYELQKVVAHCGNSIVILKPPNMISTTRNFLVLAIFTIFISNSAKAQPRQGRFVDVSIGFATSSSYENADITGTGFYAQGEYVFGLTKWVGIRPYAGIILTATHNNVINQSQQDYRVTTNAFLLGGKVRICAPIPWVAPYFEIGIGTSIGSFETYVPSIEKIEESGLIMHIPFSVGLSLGRKHNIDVALNYYFTPAVDQDSGALALGFTFPINQ
ncbi:outer membrane beta-barrel protein [Flavobacterium granuli]|uniref:Outer membrane protein beta-barrel domain-containing protein n=1 Tax=Flavobacterium granuli TaxID=280093 RepID=A0ABU1S1P7_9FLAO|nr:hypothetical protein [Flavobacterium granuli]MDR6844958.1 hypothetical protein [Flavobacterium granuli]